MKKLLLILLVFFLKPVFGQQVMMQGFYYDIPKAQCGASWADTMSLKASELSTAGFTHIWTPPFQGNGANSGGYDPRDLYIGDNTTVTPLGSKQSILDMVATFNGTGMQVVGDMIYNHRDGGSPENNDPVLDYVMNHAGNTSNQNCYQYAMPSDRYDLILPVGGSSGNGEGDYYINISSRTGTYNGSKYMLYVTTDKIGGSRWSPVNPLSAIAPEQGAAYPIDLGRNYEVTIDSDGDSDEFKITLNTADFNTSDKLLIYMININPGDITSYSNHRPWKIYYNPATSANGVGRDLADASNMFAGGGGLNPNYKLRAETYTNFCNLPSGQGCMNGSNFRPNYSGDPASDVNATCLGPAYSQQSLDYFYDYDHQNPDTKQKLIDWTLWSWNTVGIRGLRMDAIKHFPASFVGDLLCAMHAAGKDPSLIVGEWYGQDAADQSNWLTQVYAKLSACSGVNLNPKVFDFNLRDALKKASDGGNGVSTSADCDDNSAWDVRGIFDGSLHDGSSFSGNNVVTMLNNHDFRDANPTYGTSLVHDRGNALNSYAYMFTNNHLGVPTVFWPDYYGYNANVLTWDGSSCVSKALDYFPVWPQGGLKPEIDELIKVLKTYINGSSSVDYLNKFGGPAITYYSGCYKRSLIYQNNATGSVGGKEILNVINYGDDAMDVEIPLVLRNGVLAGENFTKIAGTSGTLQPVVSADGKLRVTVPAHSFATWAQGIITPLPVTLVEFKAKALPNAVQLDWKSTSESDFDGYQLQRSSDSHEFISIEWFPSKGSENVSHQYIYIDEKAPIGETVYYRLKMKDMDGTIAYSKIQSVMIDPNQLNILIAPNPVHTTAQIMLNNPGSENIIVSIYNVSGKKVIQKDYVVHKGINTLEMNISGLPVGTYILSVSDNQSTKSGKLVIQ